MFDYTCSKIFPLDELSSHLSKIRGDRKVVLATGCFDVLHVGHIRYLEAARSYGDILVVGANTDKAVREYKGEGKPVIPEHERAEMLAALQCTDFVTLYPENTNINIIRILKPDIFAKGTDYKNQPLPWPEEVGDFSGEIVFCGDEKEHSSTEIISRLKQGKE